MIFYNMNRWQSDDIAHRIIIQITTTDRDNTNSMTALSTVSSDKKSCYVSGHFLVLQRSLTCCWLLQPISKDQTTALLAPMANIVTSGDWLTPVTGHHLLTLITAHVKFSVSLYCIGSAVQHDRHTTSPPQSAFTPHPHSHPTEHRRLTLLPRDSEPDDTQTP